jgi:hypothetical protein
MRSKVALGHGVSHSTEHIAHFWRHCHVGITHANVCCIHHNCPHISWGGIRWHSLHCKSGTITKGSSRCIKRTGVHSHVFTCWARSSHKSITGSSHTAAILHSSRKGIHAALHSTHKGSWISPYCIREFRRELRRINRKHRAARISRRIIRRISTFRRHHSSFFTRTTFRRSLTHIRWN